MVEAYKPGPMAPNMMETGKMARWKAMDELFMPTKMNIVVNLSTIKQTALDSGHRRMVKFTRASGKMINLILKANKGYLMDHYMTVISTMVRSMVTESIVWLIILDTRASGSTTSCTARAR